MCGSRIPRVSPPVRKLGQINSRCMAGRRDGSRNLTVLNRVATTHAGVARFYSEFSRARLRACALPTQPPRRRLIPANLASAVLINLV